MYTVKVENRVRDPQQRLILALGPRRRRVHRRLLMSRWARKAKPPAGFEYLEPTLGQLEAEMREKVNESHEGKRKTESLWPVHQITWQRSRYIFDMYYRYKKISREVYDYCVQIKLVDAPLAAKWKKPGYEKLCCTYAINSKNFKFNTVSICRVPKKFLSEGTVVEDINCGCHGCASGGQGERNIFGNKYGQYLAAIQIARERKQAARQAAEEAEENDGPAPQGAWAAGPDEADLVEVDVDEEEEEEEEEGDGSKKRGATEADKEAEAFMRAQKQRKT